MVNAPDRQKFPSWVGNFVRHRPFPFLQASFWFAQEAQDAAYDPWAKAELVECAAEAELPPEPQPRGVILAPNGQVLADPRRHNQVPDNIT